MNGKTHIVWSIAVGLIIATIFHVTNILQLALLLLAALICGILPDIDHPKSLLGHWFKIFNYGAQHRGFMHSLWAVFVLGVIAIRIFGVSNQIAIAIIATYLTHLLLDTITPAGVYWLYPFGKIKGPIKSDGVVALVVLIVGLCLIFATAAIFVQSTIL